MCIKITALMANVALIACWGRWWGGLGPHPAVEMMFVLFAVLAAIAFVGLQRAMPKRRGWAKLSMKELGRDYGLVLKNLRFVAGAWRPVLSACRLLAWIAVAGDYHQWRKGHQL